MSHVEDPAFAWAGGPRRTPAILIRSKAQNHKPRLREGLFLDLRYASRRGCDGANGMTRVEFGSDCPSGVSACYCCRCSPRSGPGRDSHTSVPLKPPCGGVLDGRWGNAGPRRPPRGLSRASRLRLPGT